MGSSGAFASVDCVVVWLVGEHAAAQHLEHAAHLEVDLRHGTSAEVRHKALPGPGVVAPAKVREPEQVHGIGVALLAAVHLVVHALLPRAFPRRTDTLVWLDPAARTLWVGAGSTKKADGVVTQLIELLGGGLKLSLLQTVLSPATAMSAWLAEKEAPAGCT